MSKRIQLRRGTATENNNFKGAVGEVTVDTTNKTLRVHDGTTVGGTTLVNVDRLATIADAGLIRIATQAEVMLDERDDLAITPLKLPYGIRAHLNADGAAPLYACRAWANFNGTGTVSIRASGNVSSITDNGTGSYTINFTTSLPDSNYAVGAAHGLIAGGQNAVIVGSTTATSLQLLYTRDDTTNAYPAGDPATATVSVFR